MFRFFFILSPHSSCKVKQTLAMNFITKPMHKIIHKSALILILFIVPMWANATEIVQLSFVLGNGQKYQSEVLLPNENKDELYQMVFQSLHSVTLFTELKSDEEKNYPITKQVTYGLTVQSKAINQSEGLYRFSLEYMGIPTLSLSNEVENKIVFKDSPEDVKYEVNFILDSNTPICSNMSKTSNNNASFRSSFCVALIEVDAKSATN
ncbi:hypothetical protein L3V77_20130 [Vibrio sp. DW001]|uniref:hypothetical protein n=1 Tax=Vibrio sp. DW001 TaxID=2912315 RepID=UPI0023AEE588|nr:hypothetical protein [Vibrio sp. DW001]WED29721.1 hypothetical protein L3V77_20130 [Vibrio sp. DW001]